MALMDHPRPRTSHNTPNVVWLATSNHYPVGQWIQGCCQNFKSEDRRIVSRSRCWSQCLGGWGGWGQTFWHWDQFCRLWDFNSFLKYSSKMYSCQIHACFYSAPQCIASAVLVTAIPSVRLSVCSSHAGIVSKRRHVARCSLHCWIAKCV